MSSSNIKPASHVVLREQLSARAQVKTVNLDKISADDFVAGQETLTSDMILELLERAYPDAPKVGLEPTYALSFAKSMIYTVMPEHRNDRDKALDHCWMFQRPFGEETRVVSVSTHRKQPVFAWKDSFLEDHTVRMTLKNAGLVSTQIVNQYCQPTRTPLLTPISASMYNISEVSRAASHRSIAPEKIAMMINASTVSGGALLVDSDISCAAASIITSTAKMASQKDKESLVNKIVREIIHN